MQTYPIPLVPGPVSVLQAVRDAYQIDFGSSDLENDFFELYSECERGLQTILETKNQMAIQVGEGMWALWAALKSTIRPGDRVLAVATGVFGYGIGEMAQSIGAEVEVVGFGYDRTLDAEVVRKAAHRFKPTLVTSVHCETPSGTLNPLKQVGEICREVDALYYVDFVASAGGVPVQVDECHIDLGLLGSQKVLSLPPDLAMVSVSQRAWQRIEQVNYVGYDALKPWRSAIADHYMPNTHSWHSMAALRVGIQGLINEGLPNVYQRHVDVMGYCHQRLDAIGVDLLPPRRADCAPTVTAAKVPDGWTFDQLNRALRSHGMAVGGAYGPLAGKVFRVGHMGTQADQGLVESGMDVLAKVLKG